jgi:hypothetical protein
VYVRLKHTLSALSLEMLDQQPEQRPLAWLLAYARLARAGEVVPLDLLRAEARRLGPSDPSILGALEKRGLLIRTGSEVALEPGYRPHFGYFVRQVERLGAALQLVEGQEHSAVQDRALRVGGALFNAGLFFESHEYLEGVWRQTHDESRDFYHGIIQLAAAFYHYEKGNLHGARTLLAKARRRLKQYAPFYKGFQVGLLLTEMGTWEELFSEKRGTAKAVPGARNLPKLTFLAAPEGVKKS